MQATLQKNLGIIYKPGTSYKPESDNRTALISQQDGVRSNIHRAAQQALSYFATHGIPLNFSNNNQQ